MRGRGPQCFKRFCLQGRKGASATEYAVLLALLGVVVLVAAFALGGNLRGVFNTANASLRAGSALDDPTGGIASQPLASQPEEDTGGMVLRVRVEAGDTVWFYPLDVAGSTVDVGLDWGAGAGDCPTAFVGEGEVSCTYAQPGVYRVEITGVLPGVADIARSGFVEAVEQWGDVGLVSLFGAFESPAAPVDVPPRLPATVRDLSRTFANWGDFSIPAAVSNWHVGNVALFAITFGGADNIPDITGWDVSSGQDFSSMFSNTEHFNQDVSGWDVSGASTLSAMFANARAFNQDLNDWETGGVTNFSQMFRSAAVFNGAIDRWDTRSANNMWGMFQDAAAFNQPIGGWDVSGVMTFIDMFAGALVFNQPLGEWDVSAQSAVGGMFTNTPAFDQDVSSWGRGDPDNF